MSFLCFKPELQTQASNPSLKTVFVPKSQIEPQTQLAGEITQVVNSGSEIAKQMVLEHPTSSTKNRFSFGLRVSICLGAPFSAAFRALNLALLRDFFRTAL
jgi:hypothetical protein